MQFKSKVACFNQNKVILEYIFIFLFTMGREGGDTTESLGSAPTNEPTVATWMTVNEYGPLVQ
jgi:hypothetical protein